jgi:isopentenyldiphosphate isomerase
MLTYMFQEAPHQIDDNPGLDLEHDELLDLVDSNDEVIGTITAGNFYMQPVNAGYIRAADAFIQNDEGKLWVPTRSLHKAIAPSGLDF